MLAADSGFYSEANVKYLFETGVDGYLADTLFRKRDPRFASAARHPRRRAVGGPRQGLFRPEDFIYDQARRPASVRRAILYQNGVTVVSGGE